MMTMSAAALATSVPAMPMARPTSDSLRAGASLVPSPAHPHTSLTSTFYIYAATHSHCNAAACRTIHGSFRGMSYQCYTSFCEAVPNPAHAQSFVEVTVMCYAFQFTMSSMSRSSPLAPLFSFTHIVTSDSTAFCVGLDIVMSG